MEDKNLASHKISESKIQSCSHSVIILRNEVPEIFNSGSMHRQMQNKTAFSYHLHSQLFSLLEVMNGSRGKMENLLIFLLHSSCITKCRFYLFPLKLYRHMAWQPSGCCHGCHGFIRELIITFILVQILYPKSCYFHNLQSVWQLVFPL